MLNSAGPQKAAGPQIDPSPAEKFFGLAARPFSLTPDLRFAYHSRSHTHALEQVTSALRRREGLIVVTGAVGTGKTMLCRSMLESFESRTFLSVILDPGLEVEDLLRKVLTDFGIMSGIDAPAAGPISDVTRHQFVSTLQQFLASLIPLQAHAVIMIDEAQGLSPRVLEEIRLLSNFETDQAKLLQIVLVGQPELDDLLRRPYMQQINQRVARRCELQPLSESEVGDYIERRLAVAASPSALAGPGGDVSAVSLAVARFSPAAVAAVARISGGIPRLVNTLCDRALDTAYERKMRTIEPGAVTEAAERLRLDTPAAMSLPTRQRSPQLAAAVAAVVLLAGGAWWWTRGGAPAEPSTAPQPTMASPSAAAPASAASAATPASPNGGGGTGVAGAEPVVSDTLPSCIDAATVRCGADRGRINADGWWRRAQPTGSAGQFPDCGGRIQDGAACTDGCRCARRHANRGDCPARPDRLLVPGHCGSLHLARGGPDGTGHADPQRLH